VHTGYVNYTRFIGIDNGISSEFTAVDMVVWVAVHIQHNIVCAAVAELVGFNN